MVCYEQMLTIHFTNDMSDQSELKETTISGARIVYNEDCSDAAHYLEYILDRECFDVIYFYAKEKGASPFLDDLRHKYVLVKNPEFYMLKRV